MLTMTDGTVSGSIAPPVGADLVDDRLRVPSVLEHARDRGHLYGISEEEIAKFLFERFQVVKVARDLEVVGEERSFAPGRKDGIRWSFRGSWWDTDVPWSGTGCPEVIRDLRSCVTGGRVSELPDVGPRSLLCGRAASRQGNEPGIAECVQVTPDLAVAESELGPEQPLAGMGVGAVLVGVPDQREADRLRRRGQAAVADIADPLKDVPGCRLTVGDRADIARHHVS